MAGKRKKVMEGWTHLAWDNFFGWNLLSQPNKLTKQNIAILRMPFITNPCTKYIDKRSHKKTKVRITIEEIKEG